MAITKLETVPSRSSVLPAPLVAISLAQVALLPSCDPQGSSYHLTGLSTGSGYSQQLWSALRTVPEWITCYFGESPDCSLLARIESYRCRIAHRTGGSTISPTRNRRNAKSRTPVGTTDQRTIISSTTGESPLPRLSWPLAFRDLHLPLAILIRTVNQSPPSNASDSLRRQQCLQSSCYWIVLWSFPHPFLTTTNFRSSRRSRLRSTSRRSYATATTRAGSGRRRRLVRQ